MSKRFGTRGSVGAYSRGARIAAVTTTALGALALLVLQPAALATPSFPMTDSIAPTTTTAGATTGFTETFSAAAAVSGGPVTTAIPNGWTVPQTASPLGAGYVSSHPGNCSAVGAAVVSGSGPWTVTMGGVTCASTKSFTLTYGWQGRRPRPPTRSGRPR